MSTRALEKTEQNGRLYQKNVILQNGCLSLFGGSPIFWRVFWREKPKTRPHHSPRSAKLPAVASSSGTPLARPGKRCSAWNWSFNPSFSNQMGQNRSAQTAPLKKTDHFGRWFQYVVNVQASNSQKTSTVLFLMVSLEKPNNSVPTKQKGKTTR